MILGFRYRLALWHAASTVVILLILIVAADWALSRLLIRQVDSVLLTLAAEESDWVFDQVVGAHLHDLASLQGRSSLEKGVQVVDWEGNVLVRSGTLGAIVLPVSGTVLTRVRAGETVIETITLPGGGRSRLASVPLPAGAGAPYALQIAISLQSMETFLSTTRWLLLGLSAALLLVIFVLGVVLTGRALLPIGEVVAMASRIGGQIHGQRLPHPGTTDEIGRLVSTLNEMLERLDRAAQAHRSFTADAAHELRTPLSRMCAELEIALRRPRTAEQYEVALHSSLDEAERLSRLTATLLALARLDAGEGRDDLPVASSSVSAVMRDECERLRAQAYSRSIAIVLEPTPCLKVAMPAEFLSVLIGNIIDNAVRFSSPGAEVLVNVRAGDGDALLAVADSSPRIPAELHERIFERFYRSDSARSSETPGHGLGLSICQAIVEAYGGAIIVASGARSGNVFTVRLPLAREQSPPSTG